MSTFSQNREQLERYNSSEEFLFVGARTSNIETLVPRTPSTMARLENGEMLPPTKAVFATEHLDVAIFAAAVWSRDGWSGWHTYDDDQRIPHEFYAAPVVLRDALLGDGGSVYVVEKNALRTLPTTRPIYFGARSQTRTGVFSHHSRHALAYCKLRIPQATWSRSQYVWFWSPARGPGY